MAQGSRLAWARLAGRTIVPLASPSRTELGSRPSLWAAFSMAGVTTPFSAHSLWVISPRLKNKVPEPHGKLRARPRFPPLALPRSGSRGWPLPGGLSALAPPRGWELLYHRWSLGTRGWQAPSLLDRGHQPPYYL